MVSILKKQNNSADTASVASHQASEATDQKIADLAGTWLQLIQNMGNSVAIMRSLDFPSNFRFTADQ